jgi:hypothetical protein
MKVSPLQGVKETLKIILDRFQFQIAANISTKTQIALIFQKSAQAMRAGNLFNFSCLKISRIALCKLASPDFLSRLFILQLIPA